MNVPFLAEVELEGVRKREVFMDSDTKKESKDKTKIESPPSLLNRETRKTGGNAIKHANEYNAMQND